MKNNTIQLHNVDPEEFKNEILAGVQEKLEAFQNLICQENKPDYITRKKAASLLGVSLKTIHDWCNKGILKPYRLGNSVRFKKSEIIEALESPTHQSKKQLPYSKNDFKIE